MIDKQKEHEYNIHMSNRQFSKYAADNGAIGTMIPEGNYVLIMPCARPFQNDKGEWMENAKTYPYWNEFVKAAKMAIKDIKFVQVGYQGEPLIEGIDEVRVNLDLKQFTELINKSMTFVASDTYLPHLAAFLGKRGVVLWGQNNPKHFGYSLHENLYRSSKYFRRETWAVWIGYKRNADSFVQPGVVVETLKKILRERDIAKDAPTLSDVDRNAMVQQLEAGIH